MLAISRFARWVKAPSQDVAVVVVSSAALPEILSIGLHAALEGWNEVAHLHVQDMDGLQANWLTAGDGQRTLAAESACEASALLRAVSKRCYLLDLESDGQVRLAWLGSVCGHELRCLQLDPALNRQGSPVTQVEQVVDVARMLVKRILEERFLAV
ncbi:transketolase [Pseudomonas sp. BNK-43-a]|uniref:transketolase n=1 Tax=unclassified Pseudomonas TaxID=196821 RepID=UPI0039BF0394